MKRDLEFTIIICLIIIMTISSCGDKDDDDVSIVELEGRYDYFAANIDYHGSSLIFTNTPEIIDPSIIYVITDEEDLSEFNTLLSNLDNDSNALALPSLGTYDYFIFKASNACTSSYELIATEKRDGTITFTLNLSDLNDPDVTCIENFNLKLWIYRGLRV